MMLWIWVVAAIVLFGIFLYYNNNHIDITAYKLNLGAKTPFRIVQLSDLHGKQFGRGNGKLFKVVGGLKADVIAITGDLIDASGKNRQESVDFAVRLNCLCPVFYIFGNHENRGELIQFVRKSFEKSGVYLLENAFKSIEIKGNKLTFLGLNEGIANEKSYYTKRKSGVYFYPDNSGYFRKLEESDGIRIVLSHFPEAFNSEDGYKYCSYDFELQLSGHAHGGQFRLPFFGGVYSPGQGIHPRFYQGLHGNGPYMVVSRGLGNSSFPQRLFNCPEVVVIDVE